MPFPFSRRAVLAGAAVALLAGPAAAQTYPTRPITLIVPFAPGGNTDIIARVFAERMSTILGQRVVVENVAGAGGLTGSQRVARAAPDGYTIVLGTISTHVIAPLTSRQPPFDPIAAFTPISAVATGPFVLVSNPNVPVASMRDLADMIRRQPDRMSFGSAGVGTTSNMLGEWLNTLVGAKATHVAYRGSAPALTDLMGGQIQYVFDTLSATVGQINGGQLRGLAVTLPTRSALIPNVPTTAEAGFPDLVADVWTMLYAPAGTPEPIVNRLHHAVVEAGRDTSLRGRLAELATDVIAGSPAEARAFMASEMRKWRPVVEASGVRTD